MKELYHGSQRIVEVPLFGEGSPYNDYGLGFYCTEHEELAAEWACPDLNGGFVNRYLLKEEGLSVCHLNGEGYHLLNWLAILLENRTFALAYGLPSEARAYLLETFLPDYRHFDLIVGYRADDSYFGFATAFLNGTISLEQLYRAMRLGKLGEQTVLKSKKAFSAICFQDAVPAPGERYFPIRSRRDQAARSDFQQIKRESKAREGTYILDILRQNWKNDDPRLQ